MHTLINESYESIKTALHFALKGEEVLYLLCEERYDSKKTANCQSEEVDALLSEWRLQKRICERLARTLHDLNPDFTHDAFNPQTLDGKGVSFLKRLPERQANGSNVLPVRKS
jgi:hypothetical protein